MRLAPPSLFVVAMAACAKPAPAPAPEPQAEAAQTEAEAAVPAAPVFEILGPVRLVDAPKRLRAQKLLAGLPGVQRLRLDDFGEVRTLTLYGDTLSPGAPFDMALEALALYSSALGFEGMDRAGIAARVVLDRVIFDDSVMHVRVRQMHEGIAMDDRSIDVHVQLGEPARLLAISGSAALPAHIEAPEPVVPQSEALIAAVKMLSITLAPEFTTSLRYIDVEGKSLLAWRIDVRAEGVSEVLYVSAQTGVFLRKDEKIKHGTALGFTYPVNKLAGPRAWMPLSNLYVTPDDFGSQLTTDRNGMFAANGQVSFFFRGPYARVHNEATGVSNFSYVGDAEARIEFPEGDTHEAELSVWTNINRVHDFLKDNFGYAGMDRQLPVYVHSDVCNAYADPEAWDLHFGVCGTPESSRYWDLAFSAEVNIHEYLHLVADDIVKLRFSCSGESGAYGEGLSDYFACSITDEPRIGEDSGGMMGRSCENTMQYARDYDGECHDGAFLFSGSMWDLREREGKNVADALAFWSMYYTPERPTLIDVRDAVIAADRARFAGAHEQAILQAFSGHGVNDELVVFVTTDNPAPLLRPFQATVVAHAQGFDRRTVQYAWSFDDGSSATGDEVVHTVRKKSGFAKVRVSDAAGTTETGEVHFRSMCSQSGSPAWLVLALAGLLIGRRRRLR